MGRLRLFQSRGKDQPATTDADHARAGADIEVRPVVSRRDLHDFIHLPFRIYANNPNWVPRLIVEVKEFLDPKRHPFYLHGAATKFLALRGGEVVGRILVSDDPAFNAFQGLNLGCFGMFESVDDPKVAAALLDAAAGWLKSRGRDAIRGPIDYSMSYPCGLLVEGFETPPRAMMNYNPPYYGRLLEQWGLVKIKDLLAWWFADQCDMLAKWKRRAQWLQARGGIKIRPYCRKDFEAEARRCNHVFAEATSKHWGLVPLSDAEFRHLAKQMAWITAPQQVLLAEVDGKPVGFSITLPDLNEAIRPLHGRLTTFGLPIGLLRFLFRMRRIKTGRMMVLAILEAYRRRGVAEMLILNTLDYGKNVLGYTAAELSWTLEDNVLVNRTIEAVGAECYKRYRIYERSIG
jgi:GNAT superfamily N-acetyltransferase